MKEYQREHWGHLAGDAPWDDIACGWLVRELDNGHVVHVVPLAFTFAILVSPRLGALTYVDRWCYEPGRAAFDAAAAWTGDYPGSEPQGWHRHPPTGRRRVHGDPATEHIAW